MKTTLITLCLGTALISYSQTGSPPANNAGTSIRADFGWYRGGNNPVGVAGANDVLGTRWNSNIYIMTNGTVTSEFTQGGQLSSFSGNSGDGLRIRNLTPLGTSGNLDMFTSSNNGGNETHIVWGSNGQISGQNNRFEALARSQGFWFNTLDAAGIYKFARSGSVTAVIGTNNFWRIGMQSNSYPVINGNRRLEVVDLNPQLRLHFDGTNSVGGTFTDFLSNNSVNPHTKRSFLKINKV